jgi:SAM-dependent methyltransferase
MAAGWERRRALFWEATRAVSERMVEGLDPHEGDTVLDLAAGPGDTGFLAAHRIGDTGRLLSTDVAPEMVEAARRHGAELGVENVEYRVVDAAAIDLPDGSVDGVLCRYGVMLVPDCEAAAREVARVLRPGARAAVAVWAEPDRNDWMTAAGRAALALGLADRPAPDAPGPFRLADPQRLQRLLEHAGLGVTRIEEVEITWRAPSLDEWWEVTLDTSRMLAKIVASATRSQVEAIRAGAAERLARYVASDGSVAVPGVARVALAERPG